MSKNTKIVQIRSPKNSDKQQIEQLRQEREVLLQQVTPHSNDPHLTLAQILANPNTKVWIAVHDDQVAGYIVSWYKSSPYGELHATDIIIDELVLDIHQYHKQVADQLLQITLDYYKQTAEIENIYIYVPRYLPVEQAFWRAKHAKPFDTTNYLLQSPSHDWMKL